MEQGNTFSIVLIGAIVLVIIGFLFWKNMKDKKNLNPDDQDVMEEVHTEQMKKDSQL